MATRTWEGGMAAVVQVDKFTPANVEVNDIFSLTMAGKSVTYTSTAAAVAAVTAGLTAAWDGSSEPEHTTLTAADETTELTLSANTAGTPYTVSSAAVNNSTGGADDQTLTRAAVTANAGPAVFSGAANWSGETAPTTGDDIVFENSSQDCLYDLEPGIRPATLTVKQSYTGNLGLKRNNAGGYVEYLPTHLKLTGAAGITTVRIGEGDGDGPQRMKLDTSTGQATVNLYGRRSRQEAGVPQVLWKGTHASNEVNVNRGDLGIACYDGESATVATLRAGEEAAGDADVDVLCGPGASVGTLKQFAGEVTINANLTTATQEGGKLTIGRTATVGTANCRKGTFFPISNGTITTLKIGSAGIVDFRRDSRSRTITNCSLYGEGTIRDPSASVTFTNGIDLQECGLEDVTIEGGRHRTWTPSAI